MQPFLAMVYPISGHADQGLPGQGGRPDNSLPQPPRPTDPGYGHPAWGPVDPGYGQGRPNRPDQGLPGYGHPDAGLPVQPGHPSGGFPVAPGHPDAGLPGGGGGSTLPVWSPRFGWLIMHIANQPDNTLPGQPGHITGQPVPPPHGSGQPLPPGQPTRPDNTLPGAQPKSSPENPGV
jgi:hypothetical protein